VTAQTLSEALDGRVAGLSVLRSSGVAGTGSRVRLRGGSGLLIPREPLLVIDGVRVDASQSSLGVDIGGQKASRLDDVPLDEVERVEVLRGPAASALYGTDAAGGVLVVTTRQGASGKARWTSHIEGGIANDVTHYPVNTATGPPNYGRDACTRASATLGECVFGAISRWNPLEQASPFRTATGGGGSVTASGGSGRAGYFAAGAARTTQGPLPPNDIRTASARVNVDLRPVSSLDIAIRGGQVVGRTTLPTNDYSQIGVLYSGLLGNTADDPVRRGYLDNDVASISSIVATQRINRSLGSVAASWTPLRWLTARGLVGRELMRRDDILVVPSAPVFGDPTLSGIRQIQGSAGRDTRTTIGASATSIVTLSPSLTSQTVVGMERLTQSFRSRDSLYYFGEDGQPSTTSARRSHEPRKTTGAYASQQLTWGSRAFAVGVRRDNGDKFLFLKPATYWSASSTWDLTDEGFFHPSNALSALEIHASYGVAGDSRPWRIVLSSSPILPPSAGETSVLPRFAPERVSELELGLDLRSFYDNLGIQATWYRQRSTDSYERGCCIGPLGYDDGGGWRTDGLEVTLTAKMLQTLTSEWITRLTFAAISNRYDRSPSNNSRPLDSRAFFGGSRRRLVRGYPIAGIWGRPVAGRDSNRDGVIVPSEISESSDSAYLGSSIPTRDAGLATSLTVFRRLTFSAQLDYHGGFEVLNETAAFRCGVMTCAALYEPNASVSEQTRAVFGFGEGPGFLEHGDFVRLRELGLTWVLAPGWSSRVGIGRLALTVAGRNLFTATSYSGLDPEANADGQATFGTTEYFTLPLVRTLLVRFDVQH
jgi:TonB-dependent SusC/RagA subfamily outer membrane receptor